MKTIDNQELNKILEQHTEWLADNSKGNKAVLCEYDLSYKDLSNRNWQGANFRGCCFRGANLKNTNLSNAYLRNCDLRTILSETVITGANLQGVVGDGTYIKSLRTSDDYYTIIYTYDTLQIGCQQHKILDWWEFSDAKILEMDGKKALKFWREYKDIIQTLIKISPAKNPNSV